MTSALMNEQVVVAPVIGQRPHLRVVSYNIQVGITTTRPRHYLTHSWRHVLPHSQRMTNLDRIAQMVTDFDIVGLQEVDAGSLRSGFINQTEYLADKAGFPFWFHQVNRNIGRLAQHSNGLLSRYCPVELRELRLPGLIPGRGAIFARYGRSDAPLVVVMLHLALGRHARIRQLDMIGELINDYPHAILMGDMNCRPGSKEMDILFRHTNLREPLEEVLTFPSWRPRFHIDHILTTPGLHVIEARALKYSFSDHLPIAVEIALPAGMRLNG